MMTWHVVQVNKSFFNSDRLEKLQLYHYLHPRFPQIILLKLTLCIGLLEQRSQSKGRFPLYNYNNFVNYFNCMNSLFDDLLPCTYVFRNLPPFMLKPGKSALSSQVLRGLRKGLVFACIH
jgi:hypothetical protein